MEADREAQGKPFYGELEEELEDLGNRLASPEIYSDPEKVKELKALCEKKQRESSELNAIWEEMVENS